jgi:hypothetical protein
MDLNAIGQDHGFGGNVSVGNVDASELQKALTAGSQADPSQMGTGGNTLQVESLESKLVSALAEKTEDFKLMKLQPKNSVGSTVHQYSQEVDSGSYLGIGSAELGDPIESVSEFARVTRNIKYFQTKREVSVQAQALSPAIGGALEATEERLGTHVMLKGTEYLSFHGNEEVSPNLPSGYPQQIRKEAAHNVFDMGGKLLSAVGGEAVIESAIGAIYELGGEISDIFFPPVLAQDWMNLLKDRMIYNSDSRVAGNKLTTYQSMYGKDVMISGRAGIDKLYKVKTVPVPSSDLIAQKPNAPTFAAVAQAKTGGTGFTAGTAGTYRYTVYAVDASGLISDAAAAANVVVADGEEVEITITHAGTKKGTGFIVCRGKKDVTTGTDLREAYRVAISAGATTVTLDQNDELAGTAEMLLLTSDGIQASYQWDSFLDLRRFNLGPTRASIPFLLLWYGTPDMKVANFNGIIKNIGHKGIDGWY